MLMVAKMMMVVLVCDLRLIYKRMVIMVERGFLLLIHL